ncbi:MAG TPA: hypothetical protein VFY04_07070 [Solirubrobacterales bacterium]|nr:hypothetical protein [Solirubrobacterales bacterium]
MRVARPVPALLVALALLATPPASAEVAQEGGARVAVSGSLSPKSLPRTGTAPIEVRIGGHITPVRAGEPPQLERVSFGFHRAGRLETRGLPKCRIGHIEPSTTAEAMAACGDSLIGTGSFSAAVRFPEQSPFPSEGKVLAFNGVLRGAPVILAHVYGTEPLPTSYVLAMEVKRQKGTFGTTLNASFPEVTGNWGYVTGLELRLGRTWRRGGQTHSFLSAGCPAPAGFPGALFPLARTHFAFAGGTTLTTTLTRSCKVAKR